MFCGWSLTLDQIVNETDLVVMVKQIRLAQELGFVERKTSETMR